MVEIDEELISGIREVDQVLGYLGRVLEAGFGKSGCSPTCDMDWSERP